MLTNDSVIVRLDAESGFVSAISIMSLAPLQYSLSYHNAVWPESCPALASKWSLDEVAL